MDSSHRQQAAALVGAEVVSIEEAGRVINPNNPHMTQDARCTFCGNLNRTEVRCWSKNKHHRPAANMAGIVVEGTAASAAASAAAAAAADVIHVDGPAVIGRPESCAMAQSELPKMSGIMKSSDDLASLNCAAAFVESGVQDAYEDSCSICLDTFTEEEPCCKTNCNHDFHFQCILEWAQRSRECPMCWQPLALQDPDSEELLQACAAERAALARELSPPTFLRSPLDEMDFRRRYPYGEENDLERQIMQHLAAAAAGMSRTRLTNSETGRMGGGGVNHSTALNLSSIFNRPLPPHSALPETATRPTLASASGTRGSASSSEASSLASSPAGGRGGGEGGAPSVTRVQLVGGEGRAAGPSGSKEDGEGRPLREADLGGSGDLHQLADSLKSRWQAASSRFTSFTSMRTKSIREKLQLHNSAVADLSARAREVGAGVVRVLERIADPAVPERGVEGSVPPGASPPQPPTHPEKPEIPETIAGEHLEVREMGDGVGQHAAAESEEEEKKEEEEEEQAAPGGKERWGEGSCCESSGSGAEEKVKERADLVARRAPGLVPLQ